jgi:hypothetical protein
MRAVHTASMIALAVVGTGRLALAQPGATEASDPLVVKLTRSAQIAARSGKCVTAGTIGQRVLQLDPAYHARVFAPDPVITGCVEGTGTRPGPPGLAAPTPPGMSTQRPGMSERPSGGPKSETAALALSLGGTALSYGLMIAAADREDGDGETLGTIGVIGAVFAPSFGHWYAGKVLTRGLGLRAAGLSVALIAAVWAFSECPIFSSEEDCNQTAAPGILALGGVGLFVGGTIDDIVTAPRRVRDHNRAIESFAVVPMIRHGGGTVSLSGRF